MEDYDDAVWSCVRAGIPVLVRDRRRRRVYVLLAERGTGFELWRAPIDRLADYTAAAAAAATAEAGVQHTMRLAVDDSVSLTARLAFDDPAGADEFHRQLVRLSTAADDAAAAAAPSRKKRARQKGAKPISKADISQPCCFSHVTRLERGVACRGRPGLHIVVASGREMPAQAASSAGACSHAAPPPPSTTGLRTARHCQSSFTANYV